MAYSKALADKIRQAVVHLPVEEKEMFGSLAFMINGKMCLTAGADRMMCRIDPVMHEEAVGRPGCCTVVMRGREYKGYIYVDEDHLQVPSEFDYWVSLALKFNEEMKISG